MTDLGGNSKVRFSHDATHLLQHLGPLKAEQSLGTPALHKQPGQGMEPMKMSGGLSGGQLGQLAPLRGSGGGAGQVGAVLGYIQAMGCNKFCFYGIFLIKFMF